MLNIYLNYNPNYEKDRYCVQIKWYNLYEEITEYKLKKKLLTKFKIIKKFNGMNFFFCVKFCITLPS